MDMLRSQEIIGELQGEILNSILWDSGIQPNNTI